MGPLPCLIDLTCHGPNFLTNEVGTKALEVSTGLRRATLRSDQILDHPKTNMASYVHQPIFDVVVVNISHPVTKRKVKGLV